MGVQRLTRCAPYRFREISPIVPLLECPPGFSVLNSVFYLGTLIQGVL